jgi:hypothetical protein
MKVKGFCAMLDIDPIRIGYTSPVGVPGTDDADLTEPVTLSHKDFEETHIHGIGATRSGKSKWLEGFCRELIDQRLGFTLIDPQGALAENLVQYLAFYRPRQPVIYFNPSRTDYLIPFVPWRTRYMSYNDVEQRAVLSVLVSKFVETVLRVWGVEHSDDTPRLERWLTSLGYLLVSGVVTMSEVSEVLTWTEADVRRYVAARLTDVRSVQNEWRELLDYKRVIDFSNQIESVRNRLRRFYEPLQIQRITSIDGQTLDFREIFEKGAIVIANLCATDFFSQEHGRLIGTMMINELWGVARRPHKPVAPYFLLIDEVERFVTPDLADILDRGAGKGLHLGVFHQRLGQLRRRDEALYDAIMVNAKTKLVFGGLTFDAALPMVKELFVNQIDYAEAKIVIEQTKFWPRYDRDTVYMDTDGEGETDMTGAVAGFATGIGSGMSWDADAMAFFTLPEHARLSEHESRTEHQNEMRSSGRSRMRSSGRADVPIYRPEPFKEVSSITPYSLEEHWTRLAHNLMEQYQRHYFIKRRGQPAIAAVTPVIEEFRIFPRREQEYILEKLIKPHALSVEEIDQNIADRLKRLHRQARHGTSPQPKSARKEKQQDPESRPAEEEPNDEYFFQ